MASPVKLLQGIRPITHKGALRDALAGVSLAAMDIPQLLGYARIAGMPAVTGLYTALLPLLAFAFFGASRHLVVAADSATATIFSSQLSGMASLGSPEYVSLAGTVALLTAVLLLIARLLRLGFLADFLSRTALTGFLAGVGVQVALAMSGDLLGLAVDARTSVGKLLYMLGHLPQVHVLTATLALSLLLVLFAARRWAPRLPVPLLVLVGCIAASALFDFAGKGIQVLGPVAGGLPSLTLPRLGWQDIVALLPTAGACFVMIIAQSSAASRIYADRHHEHDDQNANILGLSTANAAAAFSGAFVVNGSPTQTAMAEQAGARSQFAQLAFVLVVALVLLFLCQWLQYLPHCVLAAVVFAIAIGLVDVKTLRAMRQESPMEFRMALATTLTVLLVGVEQGILLAMALSLLHHVRHSYRPHTLMLAPDAGGRWQPLAVQPGRETAPGLIVFRFGADLFYANDTFFASQVAQLASQAPAGLRWFVVDAGAITSLDYSAARTLLELYRNLSQQGVQLLFGRVNSYLRADMARHAIDQVVESRYLLPTLHEALALTGVAPQEESTGPR
ncbi:SulP family inorganic anion transporter [Pseudomonas sp. PDM23]|uniref:SulP family inorganic anion transporter n=1 Tax=unclassified Pseudomonas TaxID=196821 RepID=UPI00177D1A79|nr:MULTISPECIES: SulP family inorganic anion transporter [unclassified Pseudomonas]MBD9575878.1 SulP family inorganic anion transporter [Pseudomonas sp. PDM23]MBD9669177.1 SulP family inorganic anion transporter [Pseudomonas sp. PDM21]